MRVKASVFKIYRVVDEQGTPQHQPDGEPSLIVRNQVQVSASEGS